MTASDLTAAERKAIRRLLEFPRFELIPLDGAIEHAAFLPDGAEVSVTSSPGRTLEDTLDFCAALADLGYRPVPHLAAHMTRDIRHVAALLTRMAKLEIEDALVIGGDGAVTGDFCDAVALLRAMEDIGHDLRIDIAAYPEGHPAFGRDVASASLIEKQPHAHRMVTQLCFDGGAIVRWLDSARVAGIMLPAVVGLAGVGDRLRLMRIATRIGVGDSARFLSKHRGLVRAFVRPGRYSPESVLEGLISSFADETAGVTGVHIYTFNQVAATERWRHSYLESL